MQATRTGQLCVIHINLRQIPHNVPKLLWHQLHRCQGQAACAMPELCTAYAACRLCDARQSNSTLIKDERVMPSGDDVVQLRVSNHRRAPPSQHGVRQGKKRRGRQHHHDALEHQLIHGRCKQAVLATVIPVRSSSKASSRRVLA